MRKDTKKETPKIYKGPDYAENELGIEVPVPGSPEYYSVGDIAAEVKRILGDFGFRLADLLSERKKGNDETFSDIWGKQSLYRYFQEGGKRINMPNDVLLELPLYMEALGKELPVSQKESYMYRVNELTETIKRYCLENGVFRDTVEEYLKKQSADKLLRFLKSVYVLELPEDTWCYWLCYSTLDFATQRKAKCTLSGCTGILPHYRNTFRKLKTTYIWGPTGVGKTRSVMEQYSYSGVYRVTDYIHPFDSYAGEEVLLLDEYGSNFKIRDLLNYLDGYPLNLPCRYTNRVACYNAVYIISNLCLSKQYTDIQFDSPATFAALLRRIHTVIQYTGPGQFVEYDTAEYMDNPFLGGRR